MATPSAKRGKTWHCPRCGAALDIHEWLPASPGCQAAVQVDSGPGGLTLREWSTTDLSSPTFIEMAAIVRLREIAYR